MNLKCCLGLHDWKFCQCARCGKRRDTDHDHARDCETCAICGKVTKNAHKWSDRPSAIPTLVAATQSTAQFRAKWAFDTLKAFASRVGHFQPDVEAALRSVRGYRRNVFKKGWDWDAGHEINVDSGLTEWAYDSSIADVLDSACRK